MSETSVNSLLHNFWWTHSHLPLHPGEEAAETKSGELAGVLSYPHASYLEFHQTELSLTHVNHFPRLQADVELSKRTLSLR